MAFKKGTPKPPNSGRKKGTTNKVSRAFKDVLADVLEDGETSVRLRELRDADNPIDRSTFWRMASKFVPSKIEAGGEIVLKVLDYSDQREDEDDGEAA